MPRDVFISHSAQDKKVSETICASLEQSGIRCWIAPRDVRPGKSFPGEITRAIQQSKVMLLIFSRHSNSSEQVLREVQLAIDCHLPIVRLRIEDIPLSDDLRYYLSTPHWLDALSHPFSKHIPPLTAAIRELLGASSAESNGTSAGTSLRPEVMMKERPPALAGQKSRLNWKPFAIGAVILALGVAIALWALRSPGKIEVVTSTPTPEQSAEPSPSVTIFPVAPIQLTITPVPVPATPSPTVMETTPETKPLPTVKQPEKREPTPRNNRAWQVWIDEFVHNFIASNDSNDIALALSFYAPTVDLFEEGRKSNDAIR